MSETVAVNSPSASVDAIRKALSNLPSSAFIPFTFNGVVPTWCSCCGARYVNKEGAQLEGSGIISPYDDTKLMREKAKVYISGGVGKLTDEQIYDRMLARWNISHGEEARTALESYLQAVSPKGFCGVYAIEGWHHSDAIRLMEFKNWQADGWTVDDKEHGRMSFVWTSKWIGKKKEKSAK